MHFDSLFTFNGHGAMERSIWPILLNYRDLQCHATGAIYRLKVDNSLAVKMTMWYDRDSFVLVVEASSNTMNDLYGKL